MLGSSERRFLRHVREFRRCDVAFTQILLGHGLVGLDNLDFAYYSAEERHLGSRYPLVSASGLSKVSDLSILRAQSVIGVFVFV